MRSSFVFFFCALFFHGSAFAQQSSDTLDIRAAVVQCGAYEELPQACVYDDRCCPLKDQFYDETLADARAPAAPAPDAVELALQTPIVVAQAQFLGLTVKK